MAEIRSSSVTRVNLILDILPEDQTSPRETLNAALREYSSHNDTYVRRVSESELSDERFAEKLINEFGGKVRDNTLVNTQMRVNIAVFWSVGQDGAAFGRVKSLFTEIRQINEERYGGGWNYYLFALADIDEAGIKEKLRQLCEMLDMNVFTVVISENHFMNNISQIEAAVIFLYTLTRDSIQNIVPSMDVSGAFHFMYTQRYISPKSSGSDSGPSVAGLLEKKISVKEWSDGVRDFSRRLLIHGKLPDEWKKAVEGGVPDTELIPIPKKYLGLCGSFAKKDSDFEEFISEISESVADHFTDWCDKKTSKLADEKVDTSALVEWFNDVSDLNVFKPFDGFGSGELMCGQEMTVSDFRAVSEAPRRETSEKTKLSLREYFSDLRPGGNLRKKIKEKTARVIDDPEVVKWLRSFFYEKLDAKLSDAVRDKGLDFATLEKRLAVHLERDRNRSKLDKGDSEEDFVQNVERSSYPENIPYRINSSSMAGKRVLKFYYCDVNSAGAACGDIVSGFFKVSPSFVDSRLRRDGCSSVCVSIIICRRNVFDA